MSSNYSMLLILSVLLSTTIRDVTTRNLDRDEDSRSSESRSLFGLRPDQVLVSEEIMTSQPELEDEAALERHERRHDKRQRTVENNMIVGSRRAIEVTRVEYLRKNRCKTQPFIQVVRAEGCIKRKIVNRFCYGQCNTFYIPKLSRRNKLTAAFENCSTCKADEWEWVVVTMRCPGQTPPLQRRRIQSVKSCKCTAQ